MDFSWQCRCKHVSHMTRKLHVEWAEPPVKNHAGGGSLLNEFVTFSGRGWYLRVNLLCEQEESNRFMMSTSGSDTLEGGGGTGSQVVLRRQKPPGREKGGGLVNGVIKMNRPKSEYISPCKWEAFNRAVSCAKLSQFVDAVGGHVFQSRVLPRAMFCW